MKLYDGGRAPNPRRVRVFLAEKGIEVPTEQVDLGALQQRTEAYTAINPMQRVPALVLDDGTVIAESIAICRYFEVLHPDPPLFGRGALETALVEMWNRRAELHLLSAGVAHLPASASGHGADGSAASAGLGRGQQAARHRRFCNSSTANCKTAPMSPARIIPSPTSPRWSRSISCGCRSSRCRRTLGQSAALARKRSRRARAPRPKAAVNRRGESAYYFSCARMVLRWLAVPISRLSQKCQNLLSLPAVAGYSTGKCRAPPNEV